MKYYKIVWKMGKQIYTEELTLNSLKSCLDFLDKRNDCELVEITPIGDYE